MTAKCPECGRVFDLLDEEDTEEYTFGLMGRSIKQRSK